MTVAELITALQALSKDKMGLEIVLEADGQRDLTSVQVGLAEGSYGDSSPVPVVILSQEQR